MRALLAGCFLCAASASGSGQIGPPNLHIQSRVQSVSIRFAGQDNSNYTFTVKNDSASGVTGLDFRLIPEGIRQSGGRYQCNSRCTGSSLLGDKDTPAIKAGETRQVSFPIGSVAGGALILETAVFNSGSYEGNERGAAYLVAALAGNQAEYGLIVPAVDKIVAETASDDAHKIPEIFAALNLLDTDADASLVSSFRSWFPDLRHCDGRFLRAIDNAEFSEKNGVTERLQAYLRADVQHRGTLSSWWDSTKRYLAGFGCDGCVAQVSGRANPSEAPKGASACLKRQPPAAGATGVVVATWQIYWPDDTPAEDLAAETADSPDVATESADEASGDADTMDAAAEQPSAEQSVTPAFEPTFAPNPRTWSSDDASVGRTRPVVGAAAAQAPFAIPRNAVFPGFFSSVIGAANRSEETLYRMLFQAVGREQEVAAGRSSFLRSPSSGAESSPGLLESLSASEIQILKKIGSDYSRELAENRVIARSNMAASYVREPLAIRYWAPQTLEQHQRAEKDSQIVDAHIQDLRVLLGESSFQIVDRFLHERFHVTTPTKVVYEPLPEDQLYQRLFRYVAAINASTAEEKSEGTAEKLATIEERGANLRKALGLDDRKWKILSEAGAKYEAAELALLDEVRAMRFGPVAPIRPLPTSAPASAGLLPDKRREMQEEMTAAHIKLLESSLGAGAFGKLDALLHELYKFTTLPKGVPIPPGATEAARVPAPKSAQ